MTDPLGAHRDIITRAQQFQAEVNETLAPRSLAQEAMAAVQQHELEPEERPMLIGIGGKLESGKDTLADHLVAHYGFEKLNMSDPLAKALFTLNPWIPVTDDENTGGSEWHEFYALIEAGVPREPEDPHKTMHVRYRDIIDALGYTAAKKNLEVRRLLQVLGTEVGRLQLGDDTWTKVAARSIGELRSQGIPVVITGIRFQNELDMIREAGGIPVWIERPKLNLLAFGAPEQSGHSSPLPTESQNIGHTVISAIDDALDVSAQFHASEVTLSATDFDIEILNDGTVQQLQERALGLIEGLKSSNAGTHPDLDAPYFE